MDDQTMRELLDVLSHCRAKQAWQELLGMLSGNRDHRIDTVLRHREQLVSTRQQLEISSSLTKYRTSQMTDVGERAICERFNAAKGLLIRREIQDITAKIALMDSWLDERVHTVRPAVVPAAAPDPRDFLLAADPISECRS